MARLARIVVPGLAHHVTQRGNRGLETFFGKADYALYKALVAEQCRAAETAVLGLLPDAQPRALDPGAGRCGRPAPVPGRGAPALHPRGQPARGLDRPPVAGALPFLPHGRGPPAARGPLCRAEPRARETGAPGARLALVECAGAPRRPRRRADVGGAAPGEGRGLAGVPPGPASRRRSWASCGVTRATAGRSARWISWPAWKRGWAAHSPRGSPAARSTPRNPGRPRNIARNHMRSGLRHDRRNSQAIRSQDTRSTPATGRPLPELINTYTVTGMINTFTVNRMLVTGMSPE